MNNSNVTPNVTPEEAQSILILINRTELKGSEALVVAMIQQKLQSIAKPAIEKAEKKEKNADNNNTK